MISQGMAFAMLNVAASQLTTGNNKITTSYAGNAGFTASTGSVLVVVTAK
jgi:hypothetical protein